MAEKTYVITGATSGIGLAVAKALARQGTDLILIGRDEARGRAAMEAVRQVAPQSCLRMQYADLSRLSELRRLAADLTSITERIDVLINNAGALFDTHALTPDGLERTFALNHMSYFVLTVLLLGRLQQAQQGRVVNVSSEAHRNARLDFTDLPGRHGVKSWPAYGRSKLANILFTTELARRLARSHVTANCLHPGFVASRFGEASNGLLVRSAIRIAKRLSAISPEAGADTVVYLATSPEVANVSGRYFVKRREAEPSPAAQDSLAAAQLWQESARLSGLTEATGPGMPDLETA